MKIKELLKGIKGVFKPPIKKYYFGRLVFGTPYFFPRNFNRNILSLRKLKLTPQEELDKLPNEFQRKAKKFSNLPMVRRSKEWIIRIGKGWYWIQVGWPISIGTVDLGWKDKFESPRFEWCPMFYVFFFGLQFVIMWKAPEGDDNNYYEQILWYLVYCKKNLKKARESWPWKNYFTKESTWNDNYLLK